MTAPELADRPHYVYELLGADGKHIYIGCTSSIGARLGQHHTRDWFPEITRIEVDLYPNQRAGLDAERALIEQYSPRENHVHVPERHDAGGWEGRRTRMAESHAAGEFCFDRTCKPCIRRAHDSNVTCKDFGTCDFCADFPPWWSLMNETERRAHRDWEPIWETFLDRAPTYADYLDEPDGFTPVTRRRAS